MSESDADRALSFGVVAESYDALRPDWPAATVTWLLGEPQRSLRVLDLGAGTGKLTATLVGLGHQVVAVDPDPQMLARLQVVVPAAEARLGRAEDLPAPDAAFDAVVCGQAWHWVDPGAAVPECARVLRDRGTLGVAWHRRDPGVDWQAELDDLVDRPGDATASVRDGVLAVGPPFTAVQDAEFRYDLRLPAARLRELADTWSYVRRSPHRAAVLTAVDDLAARSADADGWLTLQHRTACFRTARTPRDRAAGRTRDRAAGRATARPATG